MTDEESTVRSEAARVLSMRGEKVVISSGKNKKTLTKKGQITTKQPEYIEKGKTSNAHFQVKEKVLRISYHNVMELLSNFFIETHKRKDDKGEDEYTCFTSQSPGPNLIMSGYKDNIREAVLTTIPGYKNTNLMIQGFLKGTIPEWSEAYDWVRSAIVEVKNSINYPARKEIINPYFAVGFENRDAKVASFYAQKSPSIPTAVCKEFFGR